MNFFRNNTAAQNKNAPVRSDALETLWVRYVHLRAASAEEPFAVNGHEYETLLNLSHIDPRAAEILFDLNLRVVADCLDTRSHACLTARERALADAWLTGLRHEVACLRYQGEIPGYPDNIVAARDEDWDLYDFAHREDLRPLTSDVLRARLEKVRIPDYSNVVSMPQTPAHPAAANA